MSDTTQAQTNADEGHSVTNGRSKLAWLWLSLSVIVVDQITKWAIVDRFVLYERIEINAVLNVTRLHKTEQKIFGCEDILVLRSLDLFLWAECFWPLFMVNFRL